MKKNWEILVQEGDDILSVRRLSDGEIFHVGGFYTIEGVTSPKIGPITKLWQSFEQMRIDVGRGGCHIDMPIHPVKLYI